MHSGFANLMAGADLVRIIATTAIIAGTLALVTEAPAQSPPSSYSSLLRDGFEVKSVIFTFNDASTRLGQSVPVGTVVTLQKGAVTARCWITYAAYANDDTGEGRLTPMNCYY